MAHFLLVVWGNKLPTTLSCTVSFTLYATACDYQKSFIADTAVKITGHIHFLIRV